MTQSYQHRPVLEIVNNCFTRLALNAVSTLDQTRMSVLALDLLNGVLQDIGDAGDWQEAYRETIVTAATSTNRFKVSVPVTATSEVVRSIFLVHFGRQTQHLMPQSIPDMKRWIRGSARGTPRHFAVIGVSGADPIMYVYPEPVTAPTEPFQFQVSMYTKHRVLATADASIIPMYNAQLVEQGLYVKLLLEESGGEPTPHVQAALVEYERMKKEELNRFNYDTGDSEIQFVLG